MMTFNNNSIKKQRGKSKRICDNLVEKRKQERGKY